MTEKQATETHTPGPWRWERSGLLAEEHDGLSYYGAILRCLGNVTPTEADARLIAAAPDLLAACKDISDSYGCCETPGCDTDNPKCIGSTARAAIAKAEGRS